MAAAAPDWPAQKTREFIAKFPLYAQVRAVFGEDCAYRVILRAALRREEETDADAFEEPRHG